MRAEHTSNRSHTWGQEASGGKIARVCALSAAVGFSVLVVVALLMNPDLDMFGWLGFVWIPAVLGSIAVYTVGTLFFRRPTIAPSRRMERYLRSASTTSAPSAEIPEPVVDEEDESDAVVVDLTQDVPAPTTTTVFSS